MIFTGVFFNLTVSAQSCVQILNPTTREMVDFLVELQKKPGTPQEVLQHLQARHWPEAAQKAHQLGHWSLGRRIEDQLILWLEEGVPIGFPQYLNKGSTEVYTVQFPMGLKGIYKPHPRYWVVSSKLRYANLSNLWAEILTYHFSRMLDFPFVPVTVYRALDGKEGSLQVFVQGESIMDTFQRTSQKPIIPRPEDLKVFDFLLQNADRSVHNQIIYRDLFWAIDNGSSFYSAYRINHSLRERSLDLHLMSRAFLGQIKALSDNQIRDLLRDYPEPKFAEEVILRKNIILNSLDESAGVSER